MKVESHKLEIESNQRLDLVDLTQKVREVFNGSMVKEGMLYLHSLHTTTAIMINEWQDALIDDLKSFLQEIVDDKDYFWHNDPEHSDCVRSNAKSHLRSAVWVSGKASSLPTSTARRSGRSSLRSSASKARSASTLRCLPRAHASHRLW